MSVIDEPLLFTPERLQAPPGHAAARVTLVGAGPGDPELLTLKAHKALQQATLVLHDHLVSDEVMAFVPAHAQRIYVGKECARHTLSQDAIIERMVALARSGRPLLRLKGGDGYIFGRGGEEAQALAEAGIPFDVIPGLSAAQGAAASAGIPLTHRDHAGTLVFTTGHLRENSENREVDLDWPMLARPRQTVVIYMGVGTLPVICRQLLAHGLPADTPAALVERATLPGERCITGTLLTLPSLALAHAVKPPALIIIGQVVGLRPLLTRSSNLLHQAAPAGDAAGVDAGQPQ